MLLQIFVFLLMCLPTAWALYDDRNGDKHPNRDLWKIFYLSVVVTGVSAFINRVAPPYLDVMRYFILTWALYVVVFPYAVNYMLWRRGIINVAKWWNHLSATAWPDRLTQWSGLPWQIRVIMLLMFLSAALAFYLCPEKVIAVENACICAALN